MHSLNEQITIVSAATDTQPETLASKVAEIAFVISNLTGWERNTNIVYPDADHKFSITINPTGSGSYANVAATFNTSIALNPTSMASSNMNLSAPITIRVHRSANEKTTYLCINDNPFNVFVYAENGSGETTLFRGNSQANATTVGYLVGANGLTAAYGKGYYFTSGEKKYSIAKFVDNFSVTGGAYHELYWVYGTVSPQLHNQLINFDGTVMRLVTMNLNVATMIFAFPVSDTDPNE